MLQLRTGMNGRQFLALLNSKLIQVVQFNTKTAAATLALQKQQIRQFWPTKIVRNSSGIASPMPELDVQEEATAKNEEIPDKKEEEDHKIEVEQQQEKQVEEAENNSTGKEPIEGQTDFGRKIYPRQNGQRELKVEYRMGKRGRKFIQFSMGFGPTTFHFPHIHVPENVFDFVRAMDEVLEAVHANQKDINEALSNRKDKLNLHTVKAKGKDYDFRLCLRIFNNSVQVQMRTAPTERKPKHKPINTFLPLHQFHWMRNAIGDSFVKNGEEDVQQQFGKRPSYPTWLNHGGSPNNLPPNNQQQQKQPQIQPMQSQQALLQQLLQLVLQRQQQLQQMQTANAQRNNNLGFGGIVPQGPDQTILMTDLLAQQQQAFTPAAPTMYNNQFDQTALANLLEHIQQTQQPTMNNDNQLMNLVNLLLQNNSGQQN